MSTIVGQGSKWRAQTKVINHCLAESHPLKSFLVQWPLLKEILNCKWDGLAEYTCDEITELTWKGWGLFHSKLLYFPFPGSVLRMIWKATLALTPEGWEILCLLSTGCWKRKPCSVLHWRLLRSEAKRGTHNEESFRFCYYSTIRFSNNSRVIVFSN